MKIKTLNDYNWQTKNANGLMIDIHFKRKNITIIWCYLSRFYFYLFFFACNWLLWITKHPLCQDLSTSSIYLNFGKFWQHRNSLPKLCHGFTKSQIARLWWALEKKWMPTFWWGRPSCIHGSHQVCFNYFEFRDICSFLKAYFGEFIETHAIWHVERNSVGWLARSPTFHKE